MSSLPAPMHRSSPARSCARGMLVTLAALAIAESHAQPQPACRSDVPQVLQLSTCVPDQRAAARAEQAAASNLASVRPAKKTLADVLRERDGNEPRQHAAPERRPDGANLIQTHTLVR